MINKNIKRLVVASACLLAIATASVSAQDAEARFALVIGNGAYAELGKLKNPVNDAQDMAAALKAIGFTVELLLDADLVTMEDAVVRLGSRLGRSAGSTGFFYYAGHGVSSDGVNYLIPADARIASETFLRTKALATQSVLDTLQSSRNALNVVVLDACRDNPFSWSRSSARGLSVVGGQPPGSIVAYATSAGSVAQDGMGRNGVFTAELLSYLRVPGIEIKDVFNRTGKAVQDATGGRQVPAVYNQFFESAFLAGSGAVGASPAPVILDPSRIPRLSAMPAARLYGAVSISAATAGTLYLDGAEIGAIAVGIATRLDDVEAGERAIEIRYSDGKNETVKVTVPNGGACSALFSYVLVPMVPAYAIGSRGPAGGFVFYDKGSYSDGWRYLEAVPSDQRIGMRWTNGSYTSIKAARATSIGSGKANTAAIIAAQGVGIYAASSCDSLVFGGYDDWFLPSRDELNLMYANLMKAGQGDFDSVWLWSSSQGSNSNAWGQGFSDGKQGSYDVGSRYVVCACRAF